MAAVPLKSNSRDPPHRWSLHLRVSSASCQLLSSHGLKQAKSERHEFCSTEQL
jgi:hypothetical protein